MRCTSVRRWRCSGPGGDGDEWEFLFVGAPAAQDPDVLLLDEPTNHLDWKCIDWLAGYLCDPRRGQRATSLLLVGRGGGAR